MNGITIGTVSGYGYGTAGSEGYTGYTHSFGNAFVVGSIALQSVQSLTPPADINATDIKAEGFIMFFTQNGVWQEVDGTPFVVGPGFTDITYIAGANNCSVTGVWTTQYWG